VTKPLSDFHVKSSSVDKHTTQCKACTQVYAKERWQREKTGRASTAAASSSCRVIEPPVAEQTCGCVFVSSPPVVPGSSMHEHAVTGVERRHPHASAQDQ